MYHSRYDKSEGVKFREDLPKKAHTGKTTCKAFWKAKFVEFCNRTDLHGYKYIVMEDLNLVQRCCWAIAVVLSIIIAIFLVVTAYRWYARNPIVTVIESTQGAIWDVPFPAVTICDLNVISRKAAHTFAYNVKLPPNVTAEFVFKTVKFAPLLHSKYFASSQQKEQLLVLQQVLDVNDMSIETFFRTLSPAVSCNQLVRRCMWKNAMYRCAQLFQEVFTLHNLCCTFNYYAVKPSYVKKTNDDDLFQLSNPRRVASCGYQTALTVLLYTDPSDYYSAMVASQGTLVYIDSAYNVPNLDSPVRMVNPSTEVLVALSPERTYTTSGIRGFSTEIRQCYYNDEIKVGVFRQYSLHNCLEYQKMELIKRRCDCVPFYFPTEEYSRICNFNDLGCLENATKPNNEDHILKLDKGSILNCLPECEHFDYPIEVAMGNLASNIQLTSGPFSTPSFENRSLLNVFFNDLVSTRYRRDVYLNWQNILAAFGGLLSLMLGFTLISGFDLILFFTLRFFYEYLPEHFSNDQPSTSEYINENDKKVNNWMKKQITQRKRTGKNLSIWKSEKSFEYRY